MKILAISSSPRRHGNTETLLDQALSGMKQKRLVIKKVVLNELDIAPCNGCQACFKTGRCVIRDDMQSIYKDLLAADRVLVAAPVYFQGTPCQLKCVIDRCQALWSRKYILKKKLVTGPRSGKRKGSAILVAASVGSKNTFIGSTIVLKAWLKTLECVYVNSLCVEGLETADDAHEKRALLKKAKLFGESLI